jgi:membrane fusion protein, multidrug efflux system
MSKFGWTAVIAAAGGAIAFLFIEYHDNAPPAAATAGGGVPVETGIALKKKVPVVLEALGNVTTIASVAIKPRIDDEIVGVHFADGAKVKEGDLLITLDKRALEAQLQQAEAVLARDQAQLEGAERDIRRNSVLTVQGAGPLLNLDNSKTQGDMFRGAIRADNAAIENLRVQLSYCEIRAPAGQARPP